MDSRRMTLKPTQRQSEESKSFERHYFMLVTGPYEIQGETRKVLFRIDLR